jgi:hypothetical protein
VAGGVFFCFLECSRDWGIWQEGNEGGGLGGRDVYGGWFRGESFFQSCWLPAARQYYLNALVLHPACSQTAGAEYFVGLQGGECVCSFGADSVSLAIDSILYLYYYITRLIFDLSGILFVITRLIFYFPGYPFLYTRLIFIISVFSDFYNQYITRLF